MKPENDSYTCACGAFVGKENAGKICGICGTICKHPNVKVYYFTLYSPDHDTDENMISVKDMMNTFNATSIADEIGMRTLIPVRFYPRTMTFSDFGRVDETCIMFGLRPPRHYNIMEDTDTKSFIYLGTFIPYFIADSNGKIADEQPKFVMKFHPYVNCQYGLASAEKEITSDRDFRDFIVDTISTIVNEKNSDKGNIKDLNDTDYTGISADPKYDNAWIVNKEDETSDNSFWYCSKCGYAYYGPEAPKSCPRCEEEITKPVDDNLNFCKDVLEGKPDPEATQHTKLLDRVNTSDVQKVAAILTVVRICIGIAGDLAWIHKRNKLR